MRYTPRSSPQRFGEAIVVLTRAVHFAPVDARLWYNLALVCSLEAERILNLAPANRTLVEVKRAVALMERARRTFAWLATLDDAAVAAPPHFMLAGVAANHGERGPRISKEEAKKRAEFLGNSLDIAKVHVDHQAKLHEKSERESRDNDKRRREAAARKEEEKRKWAAQRRQLHVHAAVCARGYCAAVTRARAQECRDRETEGR
jgi:hypothetical protein